MRFSEHLNEQSIAVLMQYGLKERYPNPVEAWEHRTNDFTRRSEEEMAIKKSEFRKQVGDNSPKLLLALEVTVIENILSIFP